MCPSGGGGIVGSGLPVDLPSMTPKQLLNFRRQLSTENKNKKNSASAASAEATGRCAHEEGQHLNQAFFNTFSDAKGMLVTTAS